jgi:hypothetical protein
MALYIRWRQDRRHLMNISGMMGLLVVGSTQRM